MIAELAGSSQRWNALALATFGLFGLSAPALAEGQSATMSVSAIVQNNCNVEATPLAFTGAVNANATSVDGTAQISVNCTSSTPFSIDMDRGVNSAGDQRRMVSADGHFLAYQIYSDPSHTQVWGMSNQGVSGQITGINRKDIIAYGRIDAIGPSTRSGTYSDTITVTVNF